MLSNQNRHDMFLNILTNIYRHRPGKIKIKRKKKTFSQIYEEKESFYSYNGKRGTTMSPELHGPKRAKDTRINIIATGRKRRKDGGGSSGGSTSGRSRRDSASAASSHTALVPKPNLDTIAV